MYYQQAIDIYKRKGFGDLPTLDDIGYQTLMYGALPAPIYPAPKAPSTMDQLTSLGSWTPDMTFRTGADVARATTDNITQAMNTGAYNPGGYFPSLSASNISNVVDANTGLIAGLGIGTILLIGLGVIVLLKLR